MAETTGGTGSEIPPVPPQTPPPTPPPGVVETKGPEPAEPPAAERPSIVDAVVDLLQTTVDWLKQEVEDTVHDKIAIPVQRVGIAIGSAAAAGCLLATGLIFIAIALLLLLARFLTWPGVLALIGFVYVVGAGIFLAIKARSMVK